MEFINFFARRTITDVYLFMFSKSDSIAEKSKNYVCEDGERLQAMDFVHCLNIVLVIQKRTDVLGGGIWWRWGVM